MLPYTELPSRHWLVMMTKPDALPLGIKMQTLNQAHVEVAEYTHLTQISLQVMVC